MRHLLSISLSLALADYAAVKTKDGILVVWNALANHFTVELKAREFEPMEHPAHFFIAVDGTPVQVLSIPVSLFQKERNDDPSPAELLRAHLEWERPNIEDLLKAKLTIHSIPVQDCGLAQHAPGRARRRGARLSTEKVAPVRHELAGISGSPPPAGNRGGLRRRLVRERGWGCP